jgi:hypothetical protein
MLARLPCVGEQHHRVRPLTLNVLLSFAQFADGFQESGRTQTAMPIPDCPRETRTDL